jgi:hypothetical protein
MANMKPRDHTLKRMERGKEETRKKDHIVCFC